MTEQGPLVLVGPSGVGKTTIAHELVRTDPRFTFSISATTRSPRGDERAGHDYDFVSHDAFQTMIRDGALAEWAEVHGEYYGTPLGNLEGSRLDGRTPVLDIDVQGATQILERVEAPVVIFILPPGPEQWIRRLAGRGTETPQQIARRLRTALRELEAAPLFEDFVVNLHVDETVQAIRRIFAGSVEAGISVLTAEALCKQLKAGAEGEIRRLETPRYDRSNEDGSRSGDSARPDP